MQTLRSLVMTLSKAPAAVAAIVRPCGDFVMYECPLSVTASTVHTPTPISSIARRRSTLVILCATA